MELDPEVTEYTENRCPNDDRPIAISVDVQIKRTSYTIEFGRYDDGYMWDTIDTDGVVTPVALVAVDAARSYIEEHAYDTARRTEPAQDD